MVLIAELVGKKLLNGTYSTEFDSNELKNKTIGLYFSAYWCRHCRNFTSKLVQAYKTALSNNSNLLFDIVFVSGDTDEESFNEYYKQMPWKVIPYENRQQAENLNERYDIEDIPSLIILKPNCEILTSEADEELISANAIEKWTEDVNVYLSTSTIDKNEDNYRRIHLDNQTIVIDDFYSDYQTKQTTNLSSILNDFAHLFTHKHKH
ncbi:unnamed protein product [Rotaria sordida]|uniref:Thioredoxin domain-containing protein n=1 Tax=Rotaria sordida TaxID=392033 RepID=A0A815C034_9BILA|nr:unnamed protein product [Rotaria sordida]CAF1276452.1 unnamed protein product [Rotaria sordida]